MKIPFTKMSGAGNDFILVDNRSNRFSVKWEIFARNQCSRRTGIGADGLLVLSSPVDAPVTMQYFNADGSSGSMCGNGGRCAAAFLLSDLHRTSVDIFAVDYLYHAELIGDNIKLHMRDPIGLTHRNQLKICGEYIFYSYCNSGSPHVIIQMKDMPESLLLGAGEDWILKIGKAVRSHEAFAPGGANVNFITVHHNGQIAMRTYERGVENETLACGTGAIACSVVTADLEHLSSPITVEARSGEELKVYFTHHDERFTEISLEGSARKLFEGVVEYE